MNCIHLKLLCFRLIPYWNLTRLSGSLFIGITIPVQAHPALDNSHVFQRGHDHVILTGRVITQPILEPFRSNLKDTLFLTVPLILFIPTAIAAIYFPLPVIPRATAPSTSALFWKGSLDRLTTVEITTALVIALGLLQTFVGIRRSKIIDWGFAKRKD